MESLASQLSSTTSVPATLLRELNAVVGSEVGFFYSYNADSDSLIFALGHNCKHAEIDRPIMAASEAAIGLALRRADGVVDRRIDDEEAPYLCQAFAERRNLKRYVAVVVRSDDEEVILGVAAVHPPADRTMSEAEQAAMRGLGRLLALAIRADEAIAVSKCRPLISGLGELFADPGQIKSDYAALEDIFSSLSLSHAGLLLKGAMVACPSADSSPMLDALIKSQPRLPASGHTEWPTGSTLFFSIVPVHLPETDAVLVLTEASPPGGGFASPLRNQSLLNLLARSLSVLIMNRKHVLSDAVEKQRRAGLTLSVAHEIGPPLQGIHSRVSILKQKYLGDVPMDKRAAPPFAYFDDVLTTVEDLQAYAGSVLALRQSNHTPVPTGLLDDIIRPVVRVVGRAGRHRQQGNSIFFSRGAFSRYVPPRMLLDPPSVKHVFYNLLHNATKYSHMGRPIHILPEVDFSWVVINVINQGIGVPAGDEERIFQQFEKGSNSDQANRIGRGAGLGLHIAREIMEKHGGSLTLTSRHAPTVFTVRFPRS